MVVPVFKTVKDITQTTVWEYMIIEWRRLHPETLQPPFVMVYFVCLYWLLLFRT